MAETIRDLEVMISGSVEGVVKEPKVTLEEAGGGKFGGFIISGSFEGKTQIERQEMLWSQLDKNLDDSYRRRVVALLTMTPDEVAGADGSLEHAG